MTKYMVTVTETHVKYFPIEATSEKEAKDAARHMWRDDPQRTSVSKSVTFEADDKPEHIIHEDGIEEAWTCICGNKAHLDGFWPCDTAGNGVTIEKDGPWDGIHYVCYSCGRIFNQKTLEVVGMNPNPILLDEI
jgi:hypothetical protein